MKARAEAQLRALSVIDSAKATGWVNRDDKDSAVRSLDISFLVPLDRLESNPYRVSAQGIIALTVQAATFIATVQW